MLARRVCRSDFAAESFYNEARRRSEWISGKRPFRSTTKRSNCRSGTRVGRAQKRTHRFFVGQACLLTRFFLFSWPGTIPKEHDLSLLQKCARGPVSRRALWASEVSQALEFLLSSFVYDVTNASSFENLSYWIEEYNRHCGIEQPSRTIPRILVGNKCDLVSETRVNTNVAQTFAVSEDFSV